MKPRGYIILGLIFLAVIVVIAVLASSSSPPANSTPNPTAPPYTPPVSQTVTVTVQNNIGIQQIEIQNLNTGKTYIATIISLPLSFNCTRGDYLKISVTTDDGYKWNAWWFSPMGIWNNDNPAIICADGKVVNVNTIIMVPNTLILNPTPTPEPTPSPTENPE